MSERFSKPTGNRFSSPGIRWRPDGQSLWFDSPWTHAVWDGAPDCVDRTVHMPNVAACCIERAEKALGKSSESFPFSIAGQNGAVIRVGEFAVTADQLDFRRIVWRRFGRNRSFCHFVMSIIRSPALSLSQILSHGSYVCDNPSTSPQFQQPIRSRKNSGKRSSTDRRIPPLLRDRPECCSTGSTITQSDWLF